MTKTKLTVDPVNLTLRDHALSLEDWSRREAVALFHQWANRFNEVFGLDLQIPVIGIDRLSVRTYATYRHGRNALGLRHEVIFNDRYMHRPLAQQLATLAHELLHLWQELFGKTGSANYHNLQFRVKAKSLGLVIDQRGHTLCIEPGPFTKLLAEHGIDLGTLPTADQPDQHSPVVQRLKGKSKLRKYCCLCTNAWIARSDPFLVCRRCGSELKPAD